MKHVKYIGPLEALRRMHKNTALVKVSAPGKVLAQFDGNEDWRVSAGHRLQHPETGAWLCLGWHEFPAADFDVMDDGA